MKEGDRKNIIICITEMWLIEKEIKQRFLINPDFILHLYHMS